MPTTFSPAFKNDVIDSLTGKSSSVLATNIQLLSGSPPADPSITPAGAAVWTSPANYTAGTNMTQATGGITQLSVQQSTNADNAITVAYARILTSTTITTGVIDTTVSLPGGGGGVIVPTLTSTVGLPFVISAFAFKWPFALNSVMLNEDAANAIVNSQFRSATTVALGSSSTLSIYSGSVPASAGVPATGSLLAVFSTTASGGWWNTASGGSAALVTSQSTTGLVSGTATYARLTKSTMTLQVEVGAEGSGKDFILNSTSITVGGTVTLTSATFVL